MIIALINWRILPKEEDVFLKKWKKDLRFGNAEGLIGEFLSKVEDGDFYTKITWKMEPDEKDEKGSWRSEDYVSYVNVGIWKSIEDFEDAVGKHMPSGRAIKEDFEAAPRRRAILVPKHWRRGSLNLPNVTSEGVSPWLQRRPL